MSDTAINSTATSSVADITHAVVAKKSAVSKKISSGKISTMKKSPTHPSTQRMVDASLRNLKERGGSSLSAIKKYISAIYKCDAQKLAPFIKKYLKNALISGKLIQTKGNGVSGSFRLSRSSKWRSKSGQKKKKAARAITKKKSIPMAAKKGRRVTA